MNNINNIASWYYHNNKIINHEQTDIYLMILCLFTKVAFEIEKCETAIGNVYFKDKKLTIEGYESFEKSHDFNEQELHILKAINKHFGYYSTKYIINNSPFTKIIEAKYYHSNDSTFEITKDDINAYLAPDISEVLSYYENELFNEYVYINGEYVFFIDDSIELTNEEKQQLINRESKQKHLDVYRDANNQLVIY